MAPQNIVISLDGATFSILQDYLTNDQLDSDTGLGYLAKTGIFLPSTPATASLTAPGHIELATGSIAANNDINSNFFHPVASPFESGISGFGAPIGRYDIHGEGAGESEVLTAEPLWLRLQEEGKTVVAATFPGADGADITLPGTGDLIQSSELRTVDYTLPFGSFAGIEAQGFSLEAADFAVAADQAEADLGLSSFSEVKVADLEAIAASQLFGGSDQGYAMQVAAIDTTDDSTANYDEVIVYDANQGIENATNELKVGSAFLSAENSLGLFYFEGSNNVVGTAYDLTRLDPTLSTVHIVRTSANNIPRNAAVIDNVDDINNNVGFWQPQSDFRIPERLSPGLEDFSDLELESVYLDLVESFVDYQTDIFLRSIRQTPNADLALGYLQQPDGAEHQFLLTDPRQPTNFKDASSIGAGQDPAVVERFAENVLFSYQVASNAVQRIIDEVGVDENGIPNSNIMVVSDHGFTPFHTAVAMDNILANAGFDPDQVRAVTSGPAVNIYINLEGREPDGTVSPEEYVGLQQQVVETLTSIQDENATYAPDGAVALFDKIYERPIPPSPTAEDIINATNGFIGQDTGDVFALLTPGYNFDGFQPEVSRQGDTAPAEGDAFFSVPNFYGMHGYDANLTSMEAAFIAAGPDFAPENFQGLDRLQNIDIAPTVLDLLGVEPADTVQGTSLLPAAPDMTRQNVSGVKFIGEAIVPNDLQVQETQVGGLSGLAYNSVFDVYYALSDDRSNIDPARFYTLSIDLSDGVLEDADISFIDVDTLLDANGKPFAPDSIDPEGIVYDNRNSLYISSEGNASNLINPFVNQFSVAGEQLGELPIPELFLPTTDQSSGIRNNLSLESLTITPDQKFLYTATEDALFQDGPDADVDQPSLSRILKYDLATGELVASFVYEVEAVPEAPDPADGFRTNGLVELLATDNNGTLLALERGFSAGVGNTVKLFEIQTQGALDVLGIDNLFREEPLDDDGEVIPPGPFSINPAVTKRELRDIERDFDIEPDNLEALAFGPKLPDGRQSLIIASDNNFSDTQRTQFLAFALDLKATPAALPVVETPLTQDDEDAATPLKGDSDDPAIWVNPVNGDDSLVITTLKDGGLATFDLQGSIVQTILPAPFGEIRYNNVDLVYGFELGGETVDLAVVSDRANDTLAIFKINPDNQQLEDVTDGNILETIFGVDDGEATAYGLATYTSPVSGTSYAFVTQADGNQVAQLALSEDNGKVTANVVRTLQLPTPTGDPEDSQSEGLVVDQELGFLYVSLEAEVGILKFSAEPTGGDSFEVIQPIGADYLVPDIEGLNIYYGADGSGYLIANSQGDSSYAVFSREGTNEYLGSFVVGGNGSIDQVNESDGLDVVNTPLGSAFPNGLLVLQDGANDPQNVVEDDDELENNSTNFKFVPWDSVANSFENPLDIDVDSFDPRNPSPQSLVNGVASGDVTQDSIVLWTRSTFPGKVTFEYSTDADFGTVTGTVTATVTDITEPVKVGVTGLDSNTEYFYRVTDAAGAQKVGRFETAAVTGEQTGLNFGVVGDWRGEIAPYPAIANVAEKNLDFFLLHGDTIYADDGSPAVLNPDGSPDEQVTSIAEFRAKHDEVYGDRFGKNFWAEVRASTAVYATIDDHEVTNDFAGAQLIGTDERFLAAFPGDDPNALINDSTLYENGLQVFQKYNPIQDEFYGETGDLVTAGERKLYRYNTFGSDAASFTLDTRSFRDPSIPAPVDFTDPEQLASVLAATFIPGRTLLGDAQKADLKADLLDAQAKDITWKFVMVPEPFQNLFPGVNTDAWDGYNAERTELLKFIEGSGIDNVVFVAADVHMTTVNNVTYQEEPFGEIIATDTFEITTGAVAYEDPTGQFLGEIFTAGNPELRAFYDSLPIAPDLDDLPNDKDDFVEAAINSTLLAPLGYDPIGLDNNLPQAEGLIDATLLQGDYYVGHSSSWAEFEIDPVTQKLTVTTWGIDGYSEEELLANPEAIINQTPTILSQFEVNPQGTLSGGTETDDTLVDGDGNSKLAGLGGNDLIAGGLGDDVILGGDGDDVLRGDHNSRSAQTGEAGGDDLIYGGAGNDRIGGKSGNDRLFGNAGDDQIWGDDGDDIIRGGRGNDILTGDNFSGAQGIDTFVLALGEGSDTITDFEVGTDLIGLAGGLSFGQISISQQNNQTAIAFADETLAVLQGVSASLLGESSFTVV
ncbi:MAG: hypothetical protein DCF15_09220 [Phormidesmis priestleyi]|uniref:BPP domain-containing protein n=1 Tax=Phormidesmis priestleyi TaxID=268141 RepID=A0A2W4XGE5_9CYAN|nr:MAG: hypothetical protein DCF15_09220 [Phormidesmis priestleyi]